MTLSGSSMSDDLDHATESCTALASLSAVTQHPCVLRSILLLSSLLLLGCGDNVIDPFGTGGGGFGGTEEPTPEEEPLPEFERDGMTVDFTMDVDGGDVDVEYRIAYWVDLERDVLNCEQRFTVSGNTSTAPTGCPDCSTHIVHQSNTATDVSEPLQRGSDCDPALLTAAQINMGQDLLSPVSQQGLADLLELAWVSAESHELAGGSLDAQGDFNFALMEQVAASTGQVYAGVILISEEGGLSQGIGLPDVSGDVGGGSGWSPFFFLLRDPAVNDHEGPNLLGRYEAQGVFSVGFAPQ